MVYKVAAVVAWFLMMVHTEEAHSTPIKLCWDYPETYTMGDPMDIDDVFKVRVWHRLWGNVPNPAWKGHLGETKAPDNCFTTKDFPDWAYVCFEVEMVMENGKESVLSDELCLIVGEI